MIQEVFLDVFSTIHNSVLQESPLDYAKELWRRSE